VLRHTRSLSLFVSLADELSLSLSVSLDSVASRLALLLPRKASPERWLTPGSEITAVVPRRERILCLQRAQKSMISPIRLARARARAPEGTSRFARGSSVSDDIYAKRRSTNGGELPTPSCNLSSISHSSASALACARARRWRGARETRNSFISIIRVRFYSGHACDTRMRESAKGKFETSQPGLIPRDIRQDAKGANFRYQDRHSSS